MSTRSPLQRDMETTRVWTERETREWLADYAWSGTPAEQAAEVACIATQGEWRHLDTQRYGTANVDDAHELALASLYENHTGPHTRDCPHNVHPHHAVIGTVVRVDPKEECTMPKIASPTLLKVTNDQGITFAVTTYIEFGHQVISFYDTSQKRFGEPGQFVASYYLITFATFRGPLAMYGFLPAWSLTADNVHTVQEFFAVLPPS